MGETIATLVVLRIKCDSDWSVNSSSSSLLLASLGLPTRLSCPHVSHICLITLDLSCGVERRISVLKGLRIQYNPAPLLQRRKKRSPPCHSSLASFCSKAVVFPARQLLPFLSPAHVAIGSATSPPAQPVSSQLQLAGFRALYCLEGSSGVCEAQGLWTHRNRAFSALGPNLSVTSWGQLHVGGRRKNSRPDMLTTFLYSSFKSKNHPHETCWELFRGKRQGLFSHWPGKDHDTEGTACLSSLVFLLRRGCACVPARCSDRRRLGGALISLKSPLILPNQG